MNSFPTSSKHHRSKIRKVGLPLCMSRSGYTYVPIGTAYFSCWDFEFRIGHDRDMPCPGRDEAYPDRDIHSGYVLDEGTFWITDMIDSAFSVFIKVVLN